jgi:hypothetical protein
MSLRTDKLQQKLHDRKVSVFLPLLLKVMKRKTYLVLILVFTFLAIIFWVLKLGYNTQLPYQTFLIIAWMVIVEYIHAKRRKMVTGKYGLNPLKIRRVIDTIKKCYGPDANIGNPSRKEEVAH